MLATGQDESPSAALHAAARGHLTSFEDIFGKDVGCSEYYRAISSTYSYVILRSVVRFLQRGGKGEEMKHFLRHYSYVALNFGFHFTLCSVFND